MKQPVPCILHTENWMSEKIIVHLLDLLAKIYQALNRCQTLNDWSAAVEYVVNTRVLGSELRPKQWRVPPSQNCTEVTRITLSNKTAPTFM
jgi:hypothetical protein